MAHDYDYVIVGSGFGGSVSALRLAEKGYKVAVIETGRRFEDKDFAKTAWNMRRYFWLPKFGLRGILRMSMFKDVFVVSGCGVGGGSLGYANTLYRPRPAFYTDPQWDGLADWEAELGPHYVTAERMLGVTLYRDTGPADALLHEYADEIGADKTYSNTQVGVFFGEAEKTVPDPYFGGEGPERTGCSKCGSCMVGCRHGAKNTLVKNYLFFAEKLGVKVFPGTEVTSVRPIGGPDGEHRDGSAGYELRTDRSGAVLRHRRRKLTAAKVIFSAGALGTNKLLANCLHNGDLPNLSKRVGHVVRTNSESIQAVTAHDDERDFSDSVAITSSIYPDPDTHIEVVTYGQAGDVMSRLYTIYTGNGTRLTRPIRFLATMARHPIDTLHLLFMPRHWSRRTVILLVMQALDSAMRLKPVPKKFGKGVRLQTEQDPERPNPTFIQAAEDATKWFAKRTGGIPQVSFGESLFNIPTTAHILGGAVVGHSPEDGVIDKDNHVFGYENLMVCDGSAVPANPGVNPSLTITAMTERAMSKIPPKDPAAELLHLPDEARPARTADTVGPARGPGPSGSAESWTPLEP
ncbi:MAG TPA: GMC family oxidoreductase [Solirubrobacterales bacterium]|jgi:cholesterol oxidase|nr:GMC family oxidoreductase [Solirubrobacterales bacterium]HMU27455.1 GMC family oxidoreductase [Solirubrobacterales bacterium]HMX71435.1 GMC family oxidoreductase [Solirubrobacterales bacterium]HMY25009.1 GMC family oxidoreductase [Solirubrobacterales bacterium]HNA23322.1 GMC family oxidoreductase [Solirubrobacterales bacterium]